MLNIEERMIYMRKKTVIILVALLAALSVGTAVILASCQNQQNSEAVQTSSVSQSSTESGTEESPEASEESVVSEETSAESSEEKSDTSAAESSESKSKTKSSQSKTEESSKKETSKAETSKTETSKTESSKTETSKTETSKAESSKAKTSKTESSKPESSKAEEPKVTGINLNMSSLSLTAGNSYELNAYVLWSNGTSSYQGITWTTSNNGVASVSSSGYVTARSAGTATITASYGSYSKSCTVTVKAAQSSQPSGGGNGGSTSKPSDGGSGSSESSKPSTDVSSMSLEEQARHYGFDLNVYDDARLHGVFWSQYGKSEGIDTKKVYPEKTFDKSSSARIKVKSNEGYEVYEVPELLTQVNKRRALKGLQPLTWQGYDAAGVKEVRDWFNDPNNSDSVDIYKSEHPNWFKNGKITDDGIKAYFDEAATAACKSIDACLRTQTLNHISGGSNINGDRGYYNPERWIDTFEMSPAHWDGLMDPDAETFYALAAPNTVANNSSGDNGYLVCIWVG